MSPSLRRPSGRTSHFVSLLIPISPSRRRYFLKAIQWARKYGIRINLDFHALPGSQNGWNHSGRLGSVNMLNGPMGLANAQRSLDYIRIIAEFILQLQYQDIVTMFGITNEPQESVVGLGQLSS
jgi:glucan 1,3-beta-glucosidase